MSVPRAIPACETKEQLIAKLQEAHALLAELQQREVELVRRSDYTATKALDQRVEEALRKRRVALFTIWHHLAEHKC